MGATKKTPEKKAAPAASSGSLPAFDAVVAAFLRDDPSVEPPDASRRAFGSNGL